MLHVVPIFAKVTYDLALDLRHAETTYTCTCTYVHVYTRTCTWQVSRDTRIAPGCEKIVVMNPASTTLVFSQYLVARPRKRLPQSRAALFHLHDAHAPRVRLKQCRNLPVMH